MLADDVAAIRFENDECMVYPAFPYQKLCSNEVAKRGLETAELEYIVGDKDKYLVPVKDIFEDRPQKLTHFFYIVKADGGELSIQKQTGFDCFRTIKDNLFLHKLAGEWEAKPDVISMSMKAASKCDVYRIVRPDGVDTLDRIRAEAEKIIERKK